MSIVKQGTIQKLRAEGIDMFDPSMLSTFVKHCPRAFKHRYRDGLRRINAQVAYGMQFGVALHKGTEVWYPSRKNDMEATKAFVDLFKQFEEPPGLSRKTGKELAATYTTILGCSLLSAYFQKYRNETVTLIENEIPLAEELEPGVFICGRIDRILESRNGIFFRDLKTTKYMNDFLIVPNLQFMTYKFLVQKFTGKHATGELDVIGVSKTKQAHELLRQEPFDYTDAQMFEWKEQVLTWIGMISECQESGIWPQSWDCKPFFRDCDYLPLCSLPDPDMREGLIETMYEVDFWDPFHSD